MSEPTLKPCPFCGCKPRYEGTTPKGVGIWSLAHSYPCPFDDEDKAQIITESEAFIWNRRAEPQELAAMVRSLLHSLGHYDKDHPKIGRYTDYLLRHGLQGNPLREPQE